jgi:hypothetical protein
MNLVLKKKLPEKMTKDTDFRKSVLVSDVGSRKNPEFVEIFPTAVSGQLNVCRNVVLFGSL